jgi:hypothetical protein
LSGLLKLSLTRPLGRLGPLELREPIEDSVSKLPFRAIVASLVESLDLALALLHFSAE